MVRAPVVWAVAALVVCLLFAFAYCAYPTPNTDAPGFLVSAINVMRGRGLVNSFYPRLQMIHADPTGLDRHIYYPPGFPLLLAALMPSPTPRAAFLVIALLRAASVGLAAVLLVRLARAAAPRRDLTALVSLALVALATNWLPTLGRPESAATLLLLAGALAAWRMEGGPLALVLGLVLGLMAAVQPFAAVEAGLVALLLLAVREPPRRALALALAAGALAVATFAALLAASPHGLVETIAGMARAYPHTPWSAPPGRDWWRPWVLWPRSTFYGPLFLAGIACGVHLLVRNRARVGAPWLVALAAAGLGACLYHGSLTHRSLRNYNALVLSPLAVGLLVAWVARRPEGPRGRLEHAGALACLAAAATGFVGQAAFLPWFLAHARTLDEARAEWRRAAPPQGRVSLVGNLWALTEDYDRLETTPATDLADPARTHPVLLIGQRREHGGRPPALPGFVLVRDFFNPALAEPGLHRYFVPEDYSFAVYVRR